MTTSFTRWMNTVIESSLQLVLMIALIQDGRAKGKRGWRRKSKHTTSLQSCWFAVLFYAQGCVLVGAKLRETRWSVCAHILSETRLAGPCRQSWSACRCERLCITAFDGSQFTWAGVSIDFMFLCVVQIFGHSMSSKRNQATKAVTAARSKHAPSTRWSPSLWALIQSIRRQHPLQLEQVVPFQPSQERHQLLRWILYELPRCQQFWCHAMVPTYMLW